MEWRERSLNELRGANLQTVQGLHSATAVPNALNVHDEAEGASPEEFATPLVLSIDIGTSRIRARLFDRYLTPLPGFVASRPQAIHYSPEDGRMEVDPDIVLASLLETLEELLALINPSLPPSRLPIAAVGVSALWHSLLAVDVEGRPLTPALLWGDRRSAPQAKSVQAEWGQDEYHRRTGAFIHPSFPAVQLRWWQEQDAALCRSVQTWMSLPDYLYLQLFGPPVLTSFSLASGTGLLSYATADWDDDVLRYLHLEREQLPRPAEIEWVRAGLRSPYRERLPRLARVPFLLPAGDGACDNLGQHALDSQHPAVMVATSAAARILLPLAALSTPAPSLFSYRLLRDLVVVGGALSNGGNLLDWCRHTFLLPDDPAALQAELAALPPASAHLQVSPDLAGRRSPDWPATAPVAGGTVAGLCLETRPVEVVQAMLEAVAFQLHAIRHQLQSARLIPGPVTWQAGGGALVNWPVWAQIIANVFGEPLALASSAESSLRGAARLALWAAGLLPSLTDLQCLPPPPGVTLQPDPAFHQLYQRLLAEDVASGPAHRPPAN
ncbi:MAG: hypothetical protein IMX01_04660 [Limnochordaceae bacterium]|nr:hypothetical protein [Limnochordaceae bacterium]